MRETEEAAPGAVRLQEAYDQGRRDADSEALAALRELVSLHEAGYLLDKGAILGGGDIRHEAWDAARSALSNQEKP